MKKLSAILVLLSLSSFLLGQGEIDDEKRIFYRNERTFGLLLNSNGIGFNFRYAKHIDGFRKTLYEVEFNHVKHKKETKLTSSNSSQAFNRSFVYGKLNNFYTLKGAFGFQKEVFRKHDKGGISIRYFYNFGPSIGLLKPIYYEVIISSPSGQESGETEIVRFTGTQHIKPGQIVGRAPFTKGLDELSVVPGAYLKGGFTFEFGKQDQVYHAIEAGLAVDAYVKTIDIMYTNDNQQFFLTLFASYRFGRIIDAQFKSRRTKVDDLLIQ